MTATDATPEQLMQAYYAILTTGPASFDEGQLRAILAADLVFEGPIAGRVVGAERFLRGVSGFAATMRSLAMLHQLCAGQTTAALYDAELPGGKVRFAEFLQIRAGKIQAVTLVYDVTEYRARGGGEGLDGPASPRVKLVQTARYRSY